MTDKQLNLNVPYQLSLERYGHPSIRKARLFLDWKLNMLYRFSRISDSVSRYSGKGCALVKMLCGFESSVGGVR